MAPTSKRKLRLESDESENEDASGGVLRPSKRINACTVPISGPAIVHTGSRVASSQNLPNENSPCDLQVGKNVDQSIPLRAPPSFKKTPLGIIPGENGVSNFGNTRWIADGAGLFVPHTSNPSIGTVPALSSLNDTHPDTVVSFTAPPTTKASFDITPEELMVDIFNFLRGDSASLYNLSLVNRRCRRIALEPLYSIFCSESILFHAGSRISAGRAFVRSIVNDAGLAQKVQSLTWAYDVDIIVQDNGRNLQRYQPDQKERRAFLLYLSQLQLPEYSLASMWMNKLHCAYREANQLAIALLHCPNLRELVVYDESMSPTYRAYDLQWLQVLKEAACGKTKGLSPKFEHLKNIEINMRGAHFRLPAISSILRLPSLRKFLISGAVESQPVLASEWDCPDSASGVENLVMSQCFFDSRVISKILSSCKAIKQFEYSYDSVHWEPLSSDVNASTWAQNSWKTVHAALEKHRNTLEVLKLGDSCDPEIVEIIMHLTTVDYERLGSFREFHKLREFEAPIIALTIFDLGASNGAPYSRVDLASSLPCEVRAVKLIFNDAMGLLTDYTMPIDALRNGLLDGTLTDLHQVCVHVKDDADAAWLQQKLTGPVESLRKEGINVEVLWGEDCISLE